MRVAFSFSLIEPLVCVFFLFFSFFFFLFLFRFFLAVGSPPCWSQSYSSQGPFYYEHVHLWLVDFYYSFIYLVSLYDWSMRAAKWKAKGVFRWTEWLSLSIWHSRLQNWTISDQIRTTGKGGGWCWRFWDWCQGHSIFQRLYKHQESNWSWQHLWTTFKTVCFPPFCCIQSLVQLASERRHCTLYLENLCNLSCSKKTNRKPSCLNDYRPTALTPVVMKCFERLVVH